MQTNPEQPIEAGKMIHVGVRHETMRNAQEPAGREQGQITKIKQQRATAKPEIDEHSRIGKRLVHEIRLNEPGHAACVASAWPRAETNMIIAHSLRISSKRKMYTPPSSPLSLT